MIWILYMIIAIATAAGATITQRFIHRKKHNLHPAAFYITSASVSSLMLGVFTIAQGLDTRWSLIPVPNLLLSIVLWSAANQIIIYTIKQTEASLFSVIFTTNSLWSIVIALFFFDESLSQNDMLSIGIILFGTLITIYQKGFKLNGRGILLSLLTAFMFGAALANNGAALVNGYSASSFTMLSFLLPVSATALLQVRAWPSVAKIVRNRHTFWPVALLGSFYGISSLCFFLAFQSGQQFSFLSALYQLQTVIAVLAAILILKERQHALQKIVGSIIAFAGTALLIIS